MEAFKILVNNLACECAKMMEKKQETIRAEFEGAGKGSLLTIAEAFYAKGPCVGRISHRRGANVSNDMSGIDSGLDQWVKKAVKVWKEVAEETLTKEDAACRRFGEDTISRPDG
ncbi:hypothetical protein IAR50_003196 [Cryptococcus sp. DSM 104548]